MNDKAMIALYLPSSLVVLLKPEKESQCKLTKDLNPIRLNDFLINGCIPFTLYTNILTFRDSNKSFKIHGDLLETMTNDDSNVSNPNPQDRKLNYEFGKEMNFNIRQKGRKTPRDQSL